MYKDPELKQFSDIEYKNEKILNNFSHKFDDIVKEAGINVQKNKELADEYYSLKNDTNKIQKKIKALKVWRWILIIFLIFPFFILTSKIKKLQPLLENNKSKLEELERELEKQLSPIRNKFSTKWLIEEIIEYNWKDIKLDPTFCNQNAADLESEYDTFMDENSCCENLIGGQLFEHPFAIFNKKQQLWKDEVYTNSVTLPYTTRINGQSTTMFETVVGTFVHPAPYWNYDTKLIFKSSFNPNLAFTTNCSKKQFKKLNKTSQVKFGNSEFDKNVQIIRNDETGIRVVFTPLAMEGFIKLFKNQKFWITKEGNITTIDLPENAPVLNAIDSNIFDHSLERWKEKLNIEISKFFYTVSKFTLPIANMPVYYQMSNKENKNNQNVSRLQVESDVEYFYNNNQIQFETNTIFKMIGVSKLEYKNIEFNVCKIQCNYFHPIHKETVVMAPSAHHGAVAINIDYIHYEPRIEYLYLLQSTNYKSDNDGWYSNCLVKNGEILSINDRQFTKTDIEKIIK